MLQCRRTLKTLHWAKQANRKKTDPVCFHWLEEPHAVKFIETEHRAVVEGRGIRRGCFSWVQVHALQDEKFCFIIMWLYLTLLNSIFKNGYGRTCLVVQRLRIHLPTQGTRVWSLVREDPTCCGAVKPVNHDYWSPWALGPELHERSRCKEEPMHRRWE